MNVFKGRKPFFKIRKFCAVCTLLNFFFFSTLNDFFCFAQNYSENLFNFPPLGEKVIPTEVFTPLLMKGITIHPDKPFRFDFIVNTGDVPATQNEIKKETDKLIKYFLASLTTAEEDMWVNLSPEEKDYITSKDLSITDLGIDMLSQDYILKQITASLLDPEDDLGKQFWDNVYKKVYQKYGTTELPINTFNKVWIFPDEAEVYEHNNSAFVVKRHLKVMLNEDYEILRSKLTGKSFNNDKLQQGYTEQLQGIASDIVREVIVPEIEKEVNEGKHFAPLRQMFNSMILAAWYKKTLKNTILSQVYVNKGKVGGIDTEDKEATLKIYDQYIVAFKKGVFNYIKEEYDSNTKKYIPRKYFSGGIDIRSSPVTAENLTVLSGNIGSQPLYVKRSLSSPIGDDFKITAEFLSINNQSKGEISNIIKERLSTPVVESINVEPTPEEPVPLVYGQSFDVTVTVDVSPGTLPLNKEDLEIAVWTNVSTGPQESFIQGFDSSSEDGWYAETIPPERITQVLDEKGAPVPNLYTGTVTITPQKTGLARFKVFTQLSGQDRVWVEANDSYIDVKLLPTWFKPAEIHPEYVVIGDLKPAGYATTFKGINEYLMFKKDSAGKNFFTLSPFFPVIDSPFAPIYEYVLNPGLIDWSSVEGEGKRIDKYRLFISQGIETRKKQFAIYRADKRVIQYAEFVSNLVLSTEDDDYSIKDGDYSDLGYSSEEELYNFILFEQFIAIEQLYNDLLLPQTNAGNTILGDLPYYRSNRGVMAKYEDVFFVKVKGILDFAALGNMSQGSVSKLGDCAAWDENFIRKHVALGNTDPRILPLKHWAGIIEKVFGDNQVRIKGWRLDAIHEYGRGSYKQKNERIYYDVTLWENLAKFIAEEDLFVLAEQLGGDDFSQQQLGRLGFIQYAIILDFFEPKNLGNLLDSLYWKSKGLSYIVIDSHDSARWAKEYFQMFQDLTGIQDDGTLEAIKNIIGFAAPTFLALCNLSQRMEFVSLSLGEYSTQDSVKEEIWQDGQIVQAIWGTKNIGELPLSFLMKKFAEIRDKNPAVSNAPMQILGNNDQQSLVSFAKVHGDNKLLIVGNFSKDSKIVETSIREAFGVSEGEVVELENLMAPEEPLIYMKDDKIIREEYEPRLLVENGIFKHELKPGQVAVYRQVGAKRKMNATQLSSPVKAWSWTDDKHREVMLHPDQTMTIENSNNFSVYLKNKETSAKYQFDAILEGDTNNYQAEVKNLPPGQYTLTFKWEGKVDNDGWEGEGGVIWYYNLMVLPTDLSGLEKGELSIRLTREDLDKYPHNTVTISNGIGTILDLPVRPSNREEKFGVIEIGGGVTKYNGFSVNLKNRGIPDEGKRILFSNTVDDITVHYNNGGIKKFSLDTTTFDHFERYPMPEWVFIVKDGDSEITISKKMVVKQGENTFAFHYEIVSATEDVDDIDLFVRPDLEQRRHHYKTTITEDGLNWWKSKHEVMRNSQNVQKGFKLHPIDDYWKVEYPGFKNVQMTITKGEYTESHERHYRFNPLEQERGEQGSGAYTDSYSPGFFTASLQKGESTSVVFVSNDVNMLKENYTDQDIKDLINDIHELVQERLALIRNVEASKDVFVKKLVLGMWEFIVERDEFYTVIAGHPWFSDWGRDTFIAFDGILASGLYDIAKGLIIAFGKFEGRHGFKGMLPNIISGEDASNWDTVDAPLLYVLAVQKYIIATGDSNILNEKSGDRPIREIIESIAEGYREGTKNGIKMDPSTGLIYSPAHFTWMDTQGPAATPRQGYTVENNARWFDVLVWISELYQGENNPTKSLEYSQLAEKVKTNFNEYFWLADKGYLADNLEADSKEVSAMNAKVDSAIRPNQLIAVLSPNNLLDKERQIAVADTVEEKLFVPTGLSTLSRDTKSSDQYPYKGTYEGSDDHGRKQAYHNGTVWPHLFGDWVLAHAVSRDFSKESINYLRTLFAPFEKHLEEGGIGSVSEVRDGDYPHRLRGSYAQAWSVTGPLNAWIQINYDGFVRRQFTTVTSASSPVSSSNNMVSDTGLGGIDLNAGLLNLHIKRDANGMPLPLREQPDFNLGIEGLFPIIIYIEPVNIPASIGLNN